MKPAPAPSATRPSDPLEIIAFCLTAPAPPTDADPEVLRRGLSDVLKRAEANLPLAGEPDRRVPGRLKALAHVGVTTAAVREVYPDDSGLAWDVYMARALAERPEETRALLARRRYLEAAVTSEANADLTLDRTIADEQLTPAALVTQPDRLPAINAAFDHFRREYTRHYLDHHHRYWASSALLHDRLLHARPRARALARLNTLTELGPPVGEATIEKLEELLREAAGCPSADGVAAALADGAVCPGCAIRLTDDPPATNVDDTLSRLDRGIERQMQRLASAAVHRTLAASGDPRIDRFLKVVQAAQLSSLVAVLDEELVGYLRRFLLESRIQGLLEPILDRVQRGSLPDEPEVREPLQELAQTLERALRATRGALPQPEAGHAPRSVKSKKHS